MTPTDIAEAAALLVAARRGRSRIPLLPQTAARPTSPRRTPSRTPSPPRSAPPSAPSRPTRPPGPSRRAASSTPRPSIPRRRAFPPRSCRNAVSRARSLSSSAPTCHRAPHPTPATRSPPSSMPARRSRSSPAATRSRRRLAARQARRLHQQRCVRPRRADQGLAGAGAWQADGHAHRQRRNGPGTNRRPPDRRSARHRGDAGGDDARRRRGEGGPIRHLRLLHRPTLPKTRRCLRRRLRWFGRGRGNLLPLPLREGVGARQDAGDR